MMEHNGASRTSAVRSGWGSSTTGELPGPRHRRPVRNVVMFLRKKEKILKQIRQEWCKDNFFAKWRKDHPRWNLSGPSFSEYSTNTNTNPRL